MILNSKLKVVAGLLIAVAAATLGVAGYQVREASELSIPTKRLCLLEDDERARETQMHSWALRNRRLDLGGRGPYEGDYIGGLVKNGAWREGLPLGPVQADAIVKLDDLIRDTFDHICLLAADYMDTNPPDYREHLARLHTRMQETIHHGERMVALGLLTEPQADYVMYRYLTGSQPFHVLSHRKMQDLLGITANQKRELAGVGEEANRREARLNLFAVDPDEQQFVAKQMEANAKWMRDAAMSVLSPSQFNTWSKLTAKRSLPARPPEWPAPTRAEAASIKIKDVSHVFRILAEKGDAFALSDKQTKLLHRLEEITRGGLFWINLNARDAAPGAADRVSQARAEFVRKAEQVALFGILTEKQAEQVKSALKW